MNERRIRSSDLCDSSKGPKPDWISGITKALLQFGSGTRFQNGGGLTGFGNVAIGRFDLVALLDPGGDASGKGGDVVAGIDEGRRRHRRAVADTAVEDGRLVLVDLVAASGQLLESDLLGTRNAGGIEFIDFNTDVNFSNCVDGFIVLDVEKIKMAYKIRYQFIEKELSQSMRIDSEGKLINKQSEVAIA